MEDPELVKARIAAMKDMYPDAVEDLPPNAPPPRGNPVEINCFVDSDHAGDKITRKSTASTMSMVGDCLLLDNSKQQTVVADSSGLAEYYGM